MSEAASGFDLFAACSCGHGSRIEINQHSESKPVGGCENEADFFASPNVAPPKLLGSRSTASTEVGFASSSSNSPTPPEDWEANDQVTGTYQMGMDGPLRLMPRASRKPYVVAEKSGPRQPIAVDSTRAGAMDGCSTDAHVAMGSNYAPAPATVIAVDKVACPKAASAHAPRIDANQVPELMGHDLDKSELPTFGEFQAAFRMDSVSSEAGGHGSQLAGGDSRDIFGDFQAAFALNDDDDDDAAKFERPSTMQVERDLSACFGAPEIAACRPELPSSSLTQEECWPLPCAGEDGVGDVSPIAAEEITGALTGALDAEFRSVHGSLQNTVVSESQTESVGRHEHCKLQTTGAADESVCPSMNDEANEVDGQLYSAAVVTLDLGRMAGLSAEVAVPRVENGAENAGAAEATQSRLGEAESVSVAPVQRNLSAEVVADSVELRSQMHMIDQGKAKPCPAFSKIGGSSSDRDLGNVKRCAAWFHLLGCMGSSICSQRSKCK